TSRLNPLSRSLLWESPDTRRLASVSAGVLSHGQQHWLEMPMCTSLNPKLLLLDEPIAGLGPEERAITGELIREAAKKCSVVIL
ncbi:MAG: ABC transporter ATP-binding protein, partial [Ideonella sp.]